ncbi:trypsin-like peptidase domain-containing protein [Luteipulveratus flavus]|uniref:Trypsin-like peptidase domain-containing protein n=1 Tax=Luteipulveratus flavus TaxID=3031728 RepID=A0ABT6C8J4_9MICO|nr:trypsin-like peptidase domain-containing protein [Luteipulveratus sp. YIM 133296]MDF8265105.1 trypsin-like peptidase domain-containing protein [Luteipulveratus sp. YIM 133296]
MPSRRTVVRLVATAAVGVAGVGLPLAHAQAEPGPSGPPQTVQRLQAAGLASTIKLDNCSASLVRFSTSKDTDKAMMLTNGHCYEGGMPSAGEVLVDQPSSRDGELLDDSGATIGSVTAESVMYATMTGTDVSLYRLSDTYADIAADSGAKALTISSSKPADQSSISIPSSYWSKTYSCGVNGFVGELREGEWTWKDSIRYRFPDDGCQTIHGTSGSPIVDDTSLEVVGVNNTGNDDGEMCTENNPCEVGEDGKTTATKGQSYGQQTYWFTTCLTADNTLDLSKDGCLLTKPGA